MDPVVHQIEVAQLISFFFLCLAFPEISVQVCKDVFSMGLREGMREREGERERERKSIVVMLIKIPWSLFEAISN